MTPHEINAISYKLEIITGVIFYIIYTILSYFLRRKSLKNINNSLLEDEYIELEPKFTFVVDTFVPFMTGGFVGGFIVPFLIYPEIQMIDTMHRQEFYFWISVLPIVLLALFYLSCTKFVLTNKRMIYGWSFRFLYSLTNIFNKFDYLNYSDIKDFKYMNFLMTNILTLYTNNKSFVISGFKNIKEFQPIIEKNR